MIADNALSPHPAVLIVDDDPDIAATLTDLLEHDGYQVQSVRTGGEAIARVSELAARAGVTARKLQRVFHSYVGVSPGWVIRRFRVQEAAERVARREVVDWSALASELGYFDQAHFIHDFKAQVGRTPGEYAAWCAADRPSEIRSDDASPS